MTRPSTPRPSVCRLEGIDVASLIRDLWRRGATGGLHLERHEIKRTLFFNEGQVVFAASSDPNDRLGEHLLRRGKTTVSQLESALAQLGPGKRVGMLMVEAGILSPEELERAVLGQVLSVVLDLLTWTFGTYRFEDGPPVEEDITLGLRTDELLMRGVRQARSLSAIERGVGPARTVFRLADDWRERVEGLDLSQAAQVLLDRLAEEPISLDTLCREVSLSNFEIYRTLWVFTLLGVAERTERRRNDGDRQGRLEDISLAELLIRGEESRRTGVLYVARGALERSFLFAAGRCVFATSNDPDDGLLNFLFRRGVISLRDKEETVRRLLSNKRVGTILRELGAIDDADLQPMVRQQVSEIVFDTMSWQDGDFVFVPSSLPCAEEITLTGSVAGLIAEGVRRIGSWTRLVLGCGGVDNPLCLTPKYLETLDEIDAGVAEWDVVNALKSPQTPRRLCGMLELDDFRVCQILWTLRLLGAVEDSPVDVQEVLLEEEEEPVDVAMSGVVDEPDVEPVEPVEPPDEDAERTLVDEAEVAVEAAGETGHDVEDTSVADEPPTPQEQVQEELNALSGGLPATTTEDEAERHTPEPEPEPEIELEPEIEIEASEPEVDAEFSEQASEDDGLGNGEPVEPELDLPPGTDEVILRFNAMHRIVFRALRAEVGAGAVNFIRSCCTELGQEVPDPLEGVDLHADGSWDSDGLKRVISDKRIEDPWSVYQRVLDQVFSSLVPHLGQARAGALRQAIWEIQQAE